MVKQEVLPTMEDAADIGIIAPYNQQVDEFNRQIPTIEAATIHKYQGREKSTIVMSVVDDQITEFADDPNLLDVESLARYMDWRKNDFQSGIIKECYVLYHGKAVRIDFLHQGREAIMEELKKLKQ